MAIIKYLLQEKFENIFLKATEWCFPLGYLLKIDLVVLGRSNTVQNTHLDIGGGVL